MEKIIGNLMAVGAESSLIMAQRLRTLREEKGLSYDRLSKELSEKYQIKISSDSLMNYETKENKNQGMRIEYLRCLADFYGVSADYLLGVASIKSSDICVQQIVEETGLTEENVQSLITWNKEKDAVYMRNAYIDLVQKLISVVSNNAPYFCLLFKNITLEMDSLLKYGSNYCPLTSVITEEAFNELNEQGYTILRTDEALEINWDQFTSMLKHELREIVQHDLVNSSDNNQDHCGGN